MANDSVSEYVPYSGIPVILSTISLSTCMVPPHYIRGGTPPSLVNQNPRPYLHMVSEPLKK